MYCNVCKKKKATVHLTEIIDGAMTELHLCEECAKEKSVQMEQQFGLADLLAGLADFGKHVKDSDQEVVKCTNCGMTYDEFKKFGRLGCSACYDAFNANLTALLRKIHGSNRHVGKAPVRVYPSGEEAVDNLQEMKQKLYNAIESEDFELAASLRDKIRELENKG